MLVCSISNLTWNKKLGTTHSNKSNDFEIGVFSASLPFCNRWKFESGQQGHKRQK